MFFFWGVGWVVEKVATHINSFKSILVCNLHWLWGEFVFENYSRVFWFKMPFQGGWRGPSRSPKKVRPTKSFCTLFWTSPQGFAKHECPCNEGGIWFYTSPMYGERKNLVSKPVLVIEKHVVGKNIVQRSTDLQFCGAQGVLSTKYLGTFRESSTQILFPPSLTRPIDHLRWGFTQVLRKFTKNIDIWELTPLSCGLNRTTRSCLFLRVFFVDIFQQSNSLNQTHLDGKEEILQKVCPFQVWMMPQQLIDIGLVILLMAEILLTSWGWSFIPLFTGF